MVFESSLPRVGVLFKSVSSVSPLQIVSSSREIVQPVFLVDDVHQFDKKQLDILKKKFVVENIKNKEINEIAERCIDLELHGLVTFSESEVENVAIICEKNGYISFSPKTGKYLQEKYLQRQALKGMHNSVRCCFFNKWLHDSILRKKIGFPVVIKPCRGAGSKWTKLVYSSEEAKEFEKKIPTNMSFVVEEYLKGEANQCNNFEIGDYISVEGIHSNGLYLPVGITGKLPISNNFSETGMFFPYKLNQKLECEVIKQCQEASKRLKITNGITHIEIKLTDRGPRIIEVNGRLGGYIYDLVKQQMGVDLISIAFKIAINCNLDISDFRIQVPKLAFQKFIIPKINHRCMFKNCRVLSTDKKVRIEFIKRYGDILDPLFGSYNNIGIIYGEAKDIQELIQINKELQNSIVIETERIDG